MLDFIFLGIVETLLGVAFTFYPPKKINDRYGYWGRSIRASQDRWQYGHKLVGPLFIIGGATAIVIGILIFKNDVVHGRGISLVISIITLVVSIVITEIKIRKINS